MSHINCCLYFYLCMVVETKIRIEKIIDTSYLVQLAQCMPIIICHSSFDHFPRSDMVHRTENLRKNKRQPRVILLIARLARSDPRNRFSVGTLLSIYSILVYFIMFSFQVLTCLRIVSIRIILNLNKFRHVQTCLRITWIVTIHIILNLNKFRHDWGW